MTSERRLDYIDGLRGLACLWVVFHHAFDGEPALPAPLRALAQTGWLGVSLFLVLSGFCLYYPLVRHQPVSGIQLDLRKFFLRRARRILPPYYLSLIVAVAILVRSQLHAGHLARDIVSGLRWDVPLHLLMLHNLTATTFSSLSSVCWSLALEWQLYLAFPLLVVGAARRGFRFVLGATLVLGLGWQGIAAARLGVSREWLPELAVAYSALPGRVFEFVCGMLAATYVARPVAKQRTMALLVGGLCLIPALVIVLFAYRFGPLCDPLWGTVFACALIALSGTRWQSGPSRVLVYLGVRSYSIYLVHLLAMLALPLPTIVQSHPLLVGSIRIVFSLLIGLGFYQIAEKPFHRDSRPV